MVDIVHYMDYRKYLHDYYHEAKKRNPLFSYQVFSEKAGISSKGLLYNVVMEKRHLSRSHIVGMTTALGLNKHQGLYFEILFNYNCAKKFDDRKHYLERLTSIRATGSTAWKPQIMRKEHYEFYSHWYHSAVRSLIGMHGFSGDYQQLAQLLYPAITAGQVKKSIELLMSLGMLRKETDTAYTLTNRTITTEAEVSSVAVHTFHVQSGELAISALKELPQHRRNFSGVTIGISESMYKEICKEIEEFRTRILQKVESDHNTDCTYQMNIQFFPFSRDPKNCGVRSQVQVKNTEEGER